MLSLLTQVSQSQLDGVVRLWEGLRRGASEPYPLHQDPSPTTPYEVIYEGGRVRLRYYRAVGQQRSIPLLLVYALIKRPYILDLQPRRSVVETLTAQGVDVYLTDWIPPTRADQWRGFDAYVNGDLAKAVRTVQEHAAVERVSLLGYCLGGLLTTLYTALHPETVKNLITLTLPLDLTVRQIPFYSVAEKLRPETIALITTLYGNCPAWLLKAGFTAMAPMHHAMDKHVGLYRNQDRPEYRALFTLIEQWMNSDVPLAGRLFQELLHDLFQRNLLITDRFVVGRQTVHLRHIDCPVLNIVAAHDDVVHPTSSLLFLDLIGSHDKRNLVFSTGHIGAVVSGAAHTQLWPLVSSWLKDRESKPVYQ
jgi:polyhydroxyalkanoate synthase